MLEIVEYLAQNGANVNYKDEDGWTPLHWAVQNGHLDIVKILIKYKADVNAKIEKGRRKGFSVLDIAVTFQHQDIIDFLKSQGAE